MGRTLGNYEAPEAQVFAVDLTMPVAGSAGSYWSSSLSTDNQRYAGGMSFFLDYVRTSLTGYRFYGQSVRPVLE